MLDSENFKNRLLAFLYGRSDDPTKQLQNDLSKLIESPKPVEPEFEFSPVTLGNQTPVIDEGPKNERCRECFRRLKMCSECSGDYEYDDTPEDTADDGPEVDIINRERHIAAYHNVSCIERMISR